MQDTLSESMAVLYNGVRSSSLRITCPASMHIYHLNVITVERSFRSLGYTLCSRTLNLLFLFFALVVHAETINYDWPYRAAVNYLRVSRGDTFIRLYRSYHLKACFHPDKNRLPCCHCPSGTRLNCTYVYVCTCSFESLFWFLCTSWFTMKNFEFALVNFIGSKLKNVHTRL